MSSTERQRFVVTYDIRDPKRLRKVFKTMKGFGRHIQLSVFLCDLSPMKLALMKAALVTLVDHHDDQILIVDVGPAEGRGLEVIDAIGRPYFERSREARIV